MTEGTEKTAESTPESANQTAAAATCRRELDLEIPADEVSKAMERVAKEFAKVARVPGFRPGKAPITLIRRRFADDIKGEVLQSLVPERVEKAVSEQKLTPVSQPKVEQLDFNDGQPLKFRAVFEVLPEFELGNYKDLQLEMPVMDVVDEDVTKTLEDMRERAAAFAPAEGRAVQDGDYVQLKLTGTPEGEGEPLQADSVLCHIGAEETMAPFNENLRGVNIGDHKDFDVPYPADYPDAKLAGKTYHYSVDVLGIKTKKLPELNDDFAKDVSDATTLDELNKKNSRRSGTPARPQTERFAARKSSGRNRQAARLPCATIAGRASNGCAPGTGGSLPGATRCRSARGKHRLGVAT